MTATNLGIVLAPTLMMKDTGDLADMQNPLRALVDAPIQARVLELLIANVYVRDMFLGYC